MPAARDALVRSHPVTGAGRTIRNGSRQQADSLGIDARK